MYKNSIIIFGIALPLLIIMIVVGIFAFVRAKVDTSYENKSAHYSGYKMNRLGAMKVEEELGHERKELERWQKLLKQETFSLVTTNLRTIAEEMPAKEFQQTAFERLPNAGGLAPISPQKSSGLKFNFRGTYRTMQQVFLRLETMMPNLQLYELSMAPNTSQDSNLLNFQVTYSAWEN